MPGWAWGWERLAQGLQEPGPGWPRASSWEGGEGCGYQDCGLPCRGAGLPCQEGVSEALFPKAWVDSGLQVSSPSQPPPPFVSGAPEPWPRL